MRLVMQGRFPHICVLSIASMLLMPLTLSADEFTDAFNASDAAFAAQNQTFNTLKSEQDAMWNRYVAEQKAAWNRYSSEIDAVWGESHAKKPTNKEWVAYSSKRDERSSIDFEKGKLQVDIMLKPGESADSPSVQERIKQQLEKLIAEPSKEDVALQISPPPQAVTATSTKSVYLLKGQLALSNGNEVNQSNAVNFAEETVRNHPAKTQMIDTPNGQRQVVSISVLLVKNHMQRRARPYLQRAQELAYRYQIPVSLIFGIMETESSFNPMAHNGVPAYGLMQLVPRSGARDAYKYVFHDDKLVTSSYLYDPSNNIELGSAYLKLLQVRELKRITNVKSRIICAIAAYNTGAGNVAKAFIPGSHNIRKASKLINRMTYEEVYEHLRQHLPYAETQRYVWKVRKFMKKYAYLDDM